MSGRRPLPGLLRDRVFAPWSSLVQSVDQSGASSSAGAPRSPAPLPGQRKPTKAKGARLWGGGFGPGGEDPLDLFHEVGHLEWLEQEGAPDALQERLGLEGHGVARGEEDAP